MIKTATGGKTTSPKPSASLPSSPAAKKINRTSIHSTAIRQGANNTWATQPEWRRAAIFQNQSASDTGNNVAAAHAPRPSRISPPVSMTATLARNAKGHNQTSSSVVSQFEFSPLACRIRPTFPICLAESMEAIWLSGYTRPKMDGRMRIAFASGMMMAMSLMFLPASTWPMGTVRQ